MSKTTPIYQLVFTAYRSSTGRTLYRVAVFDGKQCLETFDTTTPLFTLLQAIKGDLMTTTSCLDSYKLEPLEPSK